MSASGAGGLKRHSIHLGDKDMVAIGIIQEQMDLPSAALAIRIAVRTLARRFEGKRTISPAPDRSSAPDEPVSTGTK